MNSTFAASKLVRLLDAWSPMQADAPGPDVAERLSAWLGPLEAIRLQGVQQSLRRLDEDGRPAPKAAARAMQALAQDVQRVRAVLAKAIAQDPLALAALRPEDDPAYGHFRQRHLELQRQMGQMVAALRDHVRQAVSRVSPRLRQLATLDATFEDLLAVREQTNLPFAATLLERRYQSLRAAHREADDPHVRGQPGGWLHAFAQDWRQALLAELDLRLEPVMGLLDALRHDTESPPA